MADKDRRVRIPPVEEGEYAYEDLRTWGVDEEVGEALFDEYFDENGRMKARPSQPSSESRIEQK
jgi:hypothetical protein